MSAYLEIDIVERQMKPTGYLEVGIYKGQHLLSVDCPYKIGIDPLPFVNDNFPCKIYKGCSDDVFKNSDFRQEDFFDLIFIDGLHEFRQVARDIRNSLKVLSEGGMIICHDVFPFDSLSEYPGIAHKTNLHPGQNWCGDAWKAIFYVRCCLPDLDFCVVKNFPGYLYLWVRNGLKRRDAEHMTIEQIDGLKINYGIENKDKMNLVSPVDVMKLKNST